MFKTRCLPVAGSPHAALQDAFPPPAHYANARADAHLASFPCGATYAQQLLHVATSGALTDPWVRVRAGDYVNAALVATQLLAILVAVLLPRVYLRVRHWLLFAVNAVVPMGAAASVAWTPAALLPVGGAAYLGLFRGITVVLYLTWKSVYVLRVPSSYQRLFGLLLWLMTIAVMPVVRASLYPPPHAPAAEAPGGAYEDASPSTTAQLTHQQTRHYKGLVSVLQQLRQAPALWTAVLSFVVMVVLPYVIARAWERAALRPRYSAYVAAVAEAAAGGGTNRIEGVNTSDCKAAAISESGSAFLQRLRGAPETGGGVGSTSVDGAGPSLATSPAAAGAHAAADRNFGSGHHAANSLPGGTFSKPTDDSGNSGPGPAPANADTGSTEPPASSVPKTDASYSHLTDQDSNQQQQQPLQREPEDRQQAWQADGDALTSFEDTSTTPRQVLRPRRISLNIDLLMPAASRPRTSRLSAVSVDSSGLHLRGGGTGSGSVASGLCSGSKSSPCSPLYGNLSPYKTKVLSVKMPHELGSAGSHHSSFTAASAVVVDAANAAIARHNAGEAAAESAGSATGALAGATGQVPDVAASGLEGALPRVVPLSCVCVKGCMHLLMLVHEHAGGGYGAAELDEDQLPQHWDMAVDGAGGAVVRHTTITCGGGGGGEDDVEVRAAVEAAVLGMLSQDTEDSSAGGGGGCGGGAAELAALWPPAVAVDEGTGGVQGHAAEEAGNAAEAAAGSVEVVVACDASLLRGLEAVRCVVAGRTGTRGAADRQDQQGRVYVDHVIPVVGGQGQQQRQQQQQQQGGDRLIAAETGGEAVERVARLRLPLPRSALRSPGVLTLHLLPPSPADRPSVRGTQGPSGPHPHAPLCFLPLLVLPAAAAREVAQLHAYAVARDMGWGQEEGQEGERQRAAKAGEGGTANTASVSHLLAGTLSGGAYEAGAAMASLHGNGMYSLSYDFGVLLDLPYAATRCVAPAPDPWAFRGVLRLLAGQGMGACLQMGLEAAQRAGLRLLAGGVVLSGAEAGPARSDDDGEVTVDAAVRLLLGRAAAGSFQVDQRTPEEGVAQEGPCSGGAGCARPGKEQEAGAAPAGGAGASGAWADPRPKPQRHKQGLSETAATAGGTTSTAAIQPFLLLSSAAPSSPPMPPLPPLPPPRGPSWRWWLRALLLGFQPTAVEAAYQRYKAARCWSSDRVALLTHVGMSIMTLVRMLREAGGAGAGGAADGAQGAVAGTRGGYDPQLAAHGVWLGVSLASMLLLTRTPLHARHRNAALLLRGLASAAALLLVHWNPPFPPEPGLAAAAAGGGGTTSLARPWLALPVAWVLSCQKYNFHWLLLPLWEPLMLKLSVRFQAVLAAAYVPYAVLVVLRVHQYGHQQEQQQQGLLQSCIGHGGGYLSEQQASVGGGGVAALGGWRTEHTGMGAAAAAAAAWRAAVLFAVGNAVCGLVISAVTDLAGRMAFLKELRRRGAAAGQQQPLQDYVDCRGGVVDSRTPLKQR